MCNGGVSNRRASYFTKQTQRYLPKRLSVGPVIVARVQPLTDEIHHVPVHDPELFFRGVQYDDVRSVIIPENLKVITAGDDKSRWDPVALGTNVTLNQAMLLDVAIDCHFHSANCAESFGI